MPTELQRIRVIDSNIPNHWRQATFQELMDEGVLGLVQDGNHGGAYPKSDEFSETGIPLITGADLHDGVIDLEGCKFLKPESASRLRIGFAKEGDVLLTHKGTMGKTAVVPALSCPYIILNPQLTLYRVSPHSALNNRYLKYFFDSGPFQAFLQRISGISTISSLSLTVQKSLEIPIPSISEQKEIANVLGSLDDKIEQNRRTGAKLEGLARGVFKAWFVDFEPVKAKAAGATAFPGMPPETFAALPTRFTDCDLGPVPEGWVEACVEDLGTVVCGKTPSTKDTSNFGDDIAFITIPDMHGKVFITETARRLSFAGARSQQGKYVPERSICVSCIATPGLVALTSSAAQTNQQINTVIPRKGVDPHFCYQLLCRMGDQIRAGGSGGSVFHNLNKSSFSAIRITLPEAGQIDAYGAFAEPIFDTMLALARESAKLAALRDYLLPRLLSGRVRVKSVSCSPELKEVP